MTQFDILVYLTVDNT